METATDMKNAQPAIALAQPNDAMGITSIVRGAYSKYIERIGKPPAPMLDDYAKLIQANNEDRSIWALRYGDKVLGVITLGIDQNEPEALKINNVVVDSEAQGRGYGRLLMRHAEEIANAKGLRALTLFTNVKMYENLVMYPKMGFVETTRKTEDGYERVYFRKELI